ncbi:hypothetical protein DL93DRAFT_2076565 [Clavulina sp. PMI_390]|nr:hypothetical protein DL93DRAFT_2076565 [Clavulina sp. PMI_390]
MTRHRGFISAFLHALAVFTLWIVTGGLGVQDAAGVLAAPVPRLSNIKADSLTASNTFLVSLPRPLVSLRVLRRVEQRDSKADHPSLAH